MRAGRHCLCGLVRAMGDRGAAPAGRPGALLGDFRLLVYLFVGLRLMLAIVYQPYTLERYDAEGLYSPVERGLSTFGNFSYYFHLARLSDAGTLPFRDYWYEFPPVWPALFVGLYRFLALRGPVDYSAWATTLGLLLLVADVANLLVLHRLGRILHGEQTALGIAWVYALLAAPLIFVWWTFEVLVALALLGALLALVSGRLTRSAGAVIVGTLTKYIPVLIIPAVWRFYPWRQALRYTLIVLVAVGIALALLVAWGGELGLASLAAQVNKASYQSMWALIDGNYRTGNFVSPDMRHDPTTARLVAGNPPVIPAWVRLIPFAAFGGYVFVRPLRRDAQGVVAFVSMTVVLFFLWAQGWSPQWNATLVPLILLNFPTRNGVLACLLLGGVSFLEYPVLFMRTGETGGEITGALLLPYAVAILIRTGLLVGVAAALYRRLTGPTGEVLRVLQADSPC